MPRDDDEFGLDLAAASAVVAVYHCFARSGGTLVNRLLGSSSHTMVLSEVGPAASALDPVVQAVEWLGLAAPDEADALRALPLGALVRELAGRAVARDQHLVVRDFVTPNFLAGAFGAALPSRTLALVEALDAAGVPTVRAAVVRRSASAYASIVRTFPHLEHLAVDEFAVAYHGFATAIADLPVLRYEDLTADPATGLQRLTEALGCPFDASALTTFASFRRCTGDLDVERTSRGAGLDRVAELADATDAPAFAAAAAHPLCRAADELLGYEPVGRSGPARLAVEAFDGVLARTQRQLIEAGDAARRAEQLERDIHTLHGVIAGHEQERARQHQAAVRLQQDLAGLQQQVAHLQACWDETCGELARAEALNEDRRRQVGLLLDELQHLSR